MKVIKFLFSPVFMGILLLLFAVSMAVATFIENDYGSSAAYSFIYGTRWFELILLLLGVNLTGRTIILKLYKRSKLTIFLFHLSFIIIIAGAVITRYTGWKGIMHIREGDTDNSCYSDEKYLGYTLTDDNGDIISQQSDKYSATNVSADNFTKKFSVGENEYEIVLANIIPNAEEVITDDPGGEPMLSLLVTDAMQGRHSIILREGESKIISGLTIGFVPEDSADIAIVIDSASFIMSSSYTMQEMNMMTSQTRMVKAGEPLALNRMRVISVNNIRIVPQETSLSGITKVMSMGNGQSDIGRYVFLFNVFSGNGTASLYLWEKDTEEAATATTTIDGKTLTITYGSVIKTLPFNLKLNDFILEKYPGSESPSGYRSEVILTDIEKGVKKPYSIFMNNVLKYRGFRFYQASYDQDEEGTILSVNHDMAGIIVTYTGYSILIIFILLSLFNKKSVFHTVDGRNWNSFLRRSVTTIFFLVIFSGLNSISAQRLIPDKGCSEEFGKVLVQDQRGRTKPLIILSSDILRKVARENKFEGLTPMQVFMGIYLDFSTWRDVSLIKVSNKELQRLIGIRSNYASFSNLISPAGGGTYKLTNEVNHAYSLAPAERTKFDKEVMKVDERVNIVYMIYTGNFLKIFPLKDGSKNWGSPGEALEYAISKEDSVYLSNIIPTFAETMQTRNIATVKKITESVINYQERFTEYDLPPESRIKAELLYYKLRIFERLFPFYSAVGLIMLAGLIIMVIKGREQSGWFIVSSGYLLLAGFIFHTLGLGLRWYISGHSPMSNGYESMIFISWVTLLAGFIFSRKSAFTLSATALLASFALMAGHLSFMDPEITNLVPVLKSYWLTLHVSVITGSYGFLGLGAILGIITMILITLSNRKNLERISVTIDDLTAINYRTLVLGLYFLTAGTFLGAVWANESWGRYWGWDPKETWSLITIVVYTLVIHSRHIPGMKDIFTFNLLSLFAFSSVLMTYFGVNYYLSGLHSYAGGDPVPIPIFVYIIVFVLVTLSVVAYMKYKKEESKIVK